MSQSTSNIWCVLKREWKGYFATPVAFVFIVIFLVLIGFFTFSSNLGQFFEREEASLASFFTWHPWIYLFLVPSVGMRLWSEERRQGTMELLLTMPVAPWHTILGKFLASWAFLALALLLTFPIILTTSYLGEPDYGPIACGYIGSIFLAGGYLAVSSMTSALTRNQVISFILSVVICLFLVLAGYPPVTDMLVNWAPGWLVDTVTSFSVMTHFFSFQRGVLDARDIVFFLSLIGFCLFSTSVILRSLRTN
ncbi:MAG: ABC transporter permease [Verrucomicrobiales bacterium]|jgi:ABC-2 type transport system permease protein|nr:ABC transporter permease [Pedosphaera sp.]MEC7200476.1 ABC transporter permease [Verrucomicrobiota bacterium]HCB97480.1 ABC transporter permease [Verrucomicrobiales bacterium]MEC7902924.1 ABC transporter permease [Verrucomicrobiota bacterium]MEC8720280.1 ABC transporter permease [Verrucomicrobiota bacterium]